MTDGQWLHPWLFILQEKLTFHFHMRLTLVLSISTFHWLLNKWQEKAQENVKTQKCIFQNVKFENVYNYKMYFRIYYTVKFIIPQPYVKLHNKIHNTVQNWTAKCTTCCTIEFIENLNFLCVLVLPNRWKIKFTSSIKYWSC